MLDGARFMGFIPIRDAQVARTFYVDTLGLQLLADTPFALVVESGGTVLRLTPVPEFVAHPFTIAGWRVDDIEKVVSAMSAAGVTFCHYDQIEQDDSGIWNAPGGDRVAWFNDPDGNTLSVSQHVAAQ